MPRLFVGIDLPDGVLERLVLAQGGIPGARWEDREKLHLTLRYIGEVDHGVMRRAIDQLATVAGSRFELSLVGAGFFPPRGKPRSVWAGVAECPQLLDLKRRVDRALEALGLGPDTRNFAPHVTLARLRDSPRAAVMEYVTLHALNRSDPFMVDRFKLFSSVRSPGGSKYRAEAAFPLVDPP